MGSGKTAVGAALAEMLGYEFVDTDSLIVERAGQSIPEIFEKQGEKGFRVIESEVIAALSDAQSKVIATGGGAVLDPQSRHIFRAIGHTVYLKASPRELYQRVKNDTNRPLLQKAEDPKKAVERLLKEREYLYLEADIIVDTEELSIEEVTDVLIDELARRTVGDD